MSDKLYFVKNMIWSSQLHVHVGDDNDTMYCTIRSISTNVNYMYVVHSINYLLVPNQSFF